MKGGIGDVFHQETKYDRLRMPRASVDFRGRPETCKEYAQAPQTALPQPQALDSISLHDALRQRKSVRSYLDEPLTLKQLAYLIWACSGIQRTEMGCEFRTAPSAGALYPIETYVVVHRVHGLEHGVYHYHVRRHALEQLRKGDFREEASLSAMGQSMCARAGAVFVWTAVFERSKWKYRQRAYRYVYLDAGHMAQNLALAAVSLGLGSCQVGALFDDEVNRLIGVDGIEESVIYMSVAGNPGMEV